MVRGSWFVVRSQTPTIVPRECPLVVTSNEPRATNHEPRIGSSGCATIVGYVEGNRGSLVPGKYADLVLLTDDVFTIPPDKLKDTKVVWTVVGGKEVYKANW